VTLGERVPVSEADVLKLLDFDPDSEGVPEDEAVRVPDSVTGIDFEAVLVDVTD